MNRNLKVKAGIIVALVLICVYGIIGIPRSRAELLQNWKNNIHLGLDLKGGTHLVLQVQLQDAFMADAETVIDRLKEQFGKQNIAFAEITRNDLASLEDADKIQITVKGVPADRTKDIRSVASDDFPDWILTPINSTDYRLNMKPSSALKLKEDTLNQTMQTIERKINGLGLAESSVQKRGRAEAEAELLVSLPGVDDPARIKALLQEQAHAGAV
jgi:preprotein translocase subunit SecD